MIDLTDMLLVLGWSVVATVIMVQTFKWGYNKEKAGKRTDYRGRPNNNMPKKK
jgi:hypothetical protein